MFLTRTKILSRERPYCEWTYFQVNSAVATDGSLKHWINLGIRPEICLRNVDSCSEGAAISLWLKVDEGVLPYVGHILSIFSTINEDGYVPYRKGFYMIRTPDSIL